MSETSEQDKLLIDAMNRRVERRSDRRDFFKAAGAFTAGAAGMAALSACGGGGGDNSAATSTAVAQAATVSDSDILNFALNLEYLEGSFYSYAARGVGLDASLQTGTGTQGAVNAAGAQAVPFTNPVVKAYAQEIANDEINHVTFLRTALGNAAVAIPAIDVSATATGAFSVAAQAAGLVPAGTAFSPYASDVAFLLGAFIFEDVGVTAYHGAATLLANKMYLDAAAGILAVEAYHAAIVRTSLFAQGVVTPTNPTPTMVGSPAVTTAQATNLIANLRDSLDGSSTAIYSGVSTAVNDVGVGSLSATTLVPVDANSIVFDRNTAQVLNVVYGTKAAATKGLFFPNGTNGIINTSRAN